MVQQGTTRLATEAGVTIVAPATGAGRSAIGVIRISGPRAAKIAERLTGKRCPEPRRMVHRQIHDVVTGEVVDDGLIVFFPGPHSATGEDTLEIHHHGSPVVAAHLLDMLCREPLVRLAEAGEFTRRSFLNGKLDLTAAEGLADLIDASTMAQARQARRQFEGRLGLHYHEWQQTLLHALSQVEAEIDFAPEEEVPDDLFAASRRELSRILQAMRAHLDDQGAGERLRNGVVIAIIGPPNVGKSSLMNILAQRDVSIVTPYAGTTRDVVEVSLDLDGMPVTILDTAGLRETPDAIEQEGVARARSRAADADLILELRDAEDPERSIVFACEPGQRITVLNKIDLVSRPRAHSAIAISCRTGEGIDTLLLRLGEEVRKLLPSGNAPLMTRARHRDAVRAAAEALSRALERDDAKALDLAAEDLRLATHALGRLTGSIGVEDVLDQIFSNFCIGK